MAAQAVGAPRRWAAHRRVRLSRARPHTVSVDLGTGTSLVCVRERGMIRAQPSVVATERRTGAPVAVGAHAQALVQRAPHQLELVQPLRAGVIVDRRAAGMLLADLVRSVGRPMGAVSRIVVSVPGDATDGERRAVLMAAATAGVQDVALADGSMAAAIGAGVPVAAGVGSMVVDIGAGTTEAAVIADGGVVARASVRLGGQWVSAALIAHLRGRHGIVVDATTATALKRSIGFADQVEESPPHRICGHDEGTGDAATITITAAEVHEVLDGVVARVAAVVLEVLESVAPALRADVVRRGVVMTGGASRLKGLEQRLQTVVGVPTTPVAAPQMAVVVGAGRMAEAVGAR